MNSVDIKDYLKINTEEKKKKENSSYSYPTYYYEVIFDNGCDLIIRRTTGTGIQRDLTIIPSENLVFIRDVKKGVDKQVNSDGQISQFFQIYGDDFDKLIGSIKNPYYHVKYISNLASRILRIKSSNIVREFLKRAMNPYPIFGGYASNSLENLLTRQMKQNPTTFSKIYQRLVDGKSDKELENIDRILVHALGIAEKINYNNAIWMIDKIEESNSSFELPMFEGFNGTPYTLITDLIEEYKLDFQSLINYLFFDLYAQGISIINDNILSIYEDTLKMQTLMYDGKVRDKYPKHLKETHDKVTLIYNLNQEYFDHKQAVKLHNECKNLEYQDENYCIVTPEDSSELINEGISLHHCVGSYVDRVNKGRTSILFLRNVDTPNESLITIEYQDGTIKQVRGLCERLMNDKERKFFDKWTKKFKIKVERE